MSLNRRDFIRNSALTAGAFAFSSNVWSEQQPKQPLSATADAMILIWLPEGSTSGIHWTPSVTFHLRRE